MSITSFSYSDSFSDISSSFIMGVCLFGAGALILQNKSIALDKLKVMFRDLGKASYRDAWEYQEMLLQENVRLKTAAVQEERRLQQEGRAAVKLQADTRSYLLFCEHPPVYTLGKSGDLKHVLINQDSMQQMGIEFYHTNRGGDITFHGPGQIVGYPILDLEKLYTDIGRYLRELEEVIIRTLADYGLEAGRSNGETGVWIEPGVKGRERKICAMGVRCSRWITMHGFAFNINTNLDYFNHIVPCGIVGKQVASLDRELGHPVETEAVKKRLLHHFSSVFGVEIQS
jgi:lipoyl(octanoyl) transferase